ncbi:MAG: hypothetical protein ACLUOF_04310 [Ruminococcus sp.]
MYTSERFYLKAVSEDTGEVRNYRIDRMRRSCRERRSLICQSC